MRGQAWQLRARLAASREAAESARDEAERAVQAAEAAGPLKPAQQAWVAAFRGV